MVSRSARPDPTDPAPGAPQGPGRDRQLPQTVHVGRILRPHGVRGEVRVEVWSDIPDRFDPGSELLAVRGREAPFALRVESCRPVRGASLVRFAGYETRDQAAELRGVRLEIERSRVPAAPEGACYHFELVGCRCVDANEGELGEVVEVVDDGGGSLLRVRRGRREVLVPFVDAFLRQVDIEAGRIEVDLPAGLVEACGSGS